MFAGVSAVCRKKFVKTFTESEHAQMAANERAVIARIVRERQSAPLRWAYATAPAPAKNCVANDLVHHGLILHGLELARTTGHKLPYTSQAAAASLAQYMQHGMYTYTPDGGMGEANPWGYGMALYVAARYGDPARADALATIIRVRLQPKKSKPFDARQYAFVLWGLSQYRYGSH